MLVPMSLMAMARDEGRNRVRRDEGRPQKKEKRDVMRLRDKYEMRQAITGRDGDANGNDEQSGMRWENETKKDDVRRDEIRNWGMHEKGWISWFLCHVQSPLVDSKLQLSIFLAIIGVLIPADVSRSSFLVLHTYTYIWHSPFGFVCLFFFFDFTFCKQVRFDYI